ncbi:hypothetical protein LCGC14_2425740 [marine sediment metagenome]|uniref:Uncharacterized protein n=1 Tax=marine sediment metagenome TaxID=412755 RepID=A0A0F9BND6_9ZZZZ
MSWDFLMAISQGILVPAPLIALVNARTYVPRWSSGTVVIGLTGVTVAVFGLGAVFGGVVAGLEVALWGLVFAFRGGRK